MNSERQGRKAYIGLGSNLGNREGYLKEALRLLNEHAQIDIEQHSNIYETDPVGNVDQGAFLNMAAKLITSLGPEELLKAMMKVEAELGREREIRWGPRTIDLDMLLYEGTVLHSGTLIVPHPRMYERAFVLVPLSDIAEGQDCPELAEMLAALDDKGGVRLWKKAGWHRESGHSVS